MRAGSRDQEHDRAAGSRSGSRMDDGATGAAGRDAPPPSSRGPCAPRTTAAIAARVDAALGPPLESDLLCERE